MSRMGRRAGGQEGQEARRRGHEARREGGRESRTAARKQQKCSRKSSKRQQKAAEKQQKKHQTTAEHSTKQQKTANKSRKHQKSRTSSRGANKKRAPRSADSRGDSLKNKSQKQKAKAAKSKHPDRQILEGICSKTGDKKQRKSSQNWAPRSADSRGDSLQKQVAKQKAKTATNEHPDRQILGVIRRKTSGNDNNLLGASGSESRGEKHRLAPIGGR